MHEKSIQITTPAGTMETFVACPEGRPARPVVVLYMDALGIRDELRRMTRRVAEAGYYAMLGNLFYRAGGPSFDASRLPDFVDPRMHELNHATTLAMVSADTAAMLAYAEGDPAADAGRVGCIGFCMGGRHAYHAAGTYPERVRAAASVHGGFLVTEHDDSPHRLTAKVRGELYFAFADGDPVAPPEHLERIRAEMAEHGVDGRAELLAGARHGFIFPERFCYDETAAVRVWAQWLDMLASTMG